MGLAELTCFVCKVVGCQDTNRMFSGFDGFQNDFGFSSWTYHEINRL